MSEVVGAVEVGASSSAAPADLVAALSELEDVARSQTADAGTYTYRYADLADILGAARPILAKHNLAVTQPVDSVDGVVHVKTRFWHVSGQVFDSPALSMPQPAGAQGLGSAITYLRRYSLLAALGLATEDDDGKAATAAVTPPRHTGRGRSAPADEATRRTRHAMALFNELGLGARDDRLAVTSDILGRDVGSWSELSPSEANRVISELMIRRDEERQVDAMSTLWDEADDADT